MVVGFRQGGRGLPAHARVLEVADALADACRRERVPALVGALGEAGVGALLSADRGIRPRRRADRGLRGGQAAAARQ